MIDIEQRTKLTETQREGWLKKYHSQREVELVHTLSGIPVAPVYTPLDIPDFNYLKDLGFPGEAPYTRGVYPTMYRGRSWTMRQLGGFGPPEETNKRLKFLLKEGATGVNLVFDYPTLRGYDSDDPKAEADAGRGGVAIDSLLDMEITFDGIPIDKVSVSLVTCLPCSAISLLSMYFAVAEKRGIDLSSLPGTTQNDFLMGSVMNTAPEIIPPKHTFRVSCDVIEFCTQHAPHWNPISYAGYNYREGGMNAIQEIASVISHATACSEEMLRRGWKVDDFAPRLSFFLSAHNDFFEEIAKYRAARRV
jgi:methylmalonyl-CoA mutase N-terminal domain